MGDEVAPDPGGRPFLCLANVSPRATAVRRPSGFDGPGMSVLKAAVLPEGPVRLAPYEVLWWVAAP